MPNILEFTIKLRDQFTSGLMGMSSNVNKQFERMNRATRPVIRSLNDIQTQMRECERTIKMSVDSRQVSAASRELKMLRSQEAAFNTKYGLGSSSGGGSMGMIGMLGRFAGPAALAASAWSSGKAIIGGGAQAETDIVGLSTFLGKAGAQNAYANIQADAAATPFNTKSLLEVNRSLISTGLSAERARFDTMNLANAVSAVGGTDDHLTRMAANMQQIQNNGRATAMDIRQFGIAGINIYKLLSDVTGKNIKDNDNLVVSYDLISQALDHASKKGGAYYGALEAQSKTTSGRWSTFIDNLQIGAAKIGSYFNNTFGRVLDWVNKNIIEGWGDRVVRTFERIRLSGVFLKLVFQDIYDNVSYYLSLAILKIQEFIDEFKHGLQKAQVSITLAKQGNFGAALNNWSTDYISPYAKKINALTSEHDNYQKANSDKKVQTVLDILNVGKNSAKKEDKGTSPFGGSGNNGGATVKDLAKNVDTITGGGAKNVYISLGKFQDQLIIKTTTIKEGLNEMEDMIERSLLRLLNSANTITQ